MAILRNIILSAALALALTSCYTDFEPKLENETVLALSSLITADQPVSMYVTHTRRYSQTQTSEESLTVKDAVVQMFINDKFVENLTYTETETVNYYEETVIERTYCSTVAPKSGDRVKFIASSDKYGTAEAEVTVPMPVPVDSVDCEVLPTYAGNSHIYTDDYEQIPSEYVSAQVTMNINFTDPANTNNYYLFKASPYVPDNGDNRIYLNIGSLDYDLEPLFSEHISAFEALNGGSAWGCTFFTDNQISGRSYPLHIRFTNMRYEVYNPDKDDALYDARIMLCLYSISESYYKWLLYKWQEDDGVKGMLSDAGLGEVLLSYSNVSTGAGLVAARTPSVHSLSLAAAIKDALTAAENGTEFGQGASWLSNY
jgi:hypothetical protein